ncbi:DUF3054 domain-containing protein [Georgenia sp. M64]|jgi:hypothetical protein|uniref:DUF3054 domain-containing protein n=1 Tax=Georgenia sp. M64 TaxID=3120520 RepID=UPI0030E50FE0
MDTAPEPVVPDQVHPAWWFGIDAAAVLVFALVGMLSHGSDGYLGIVWPFLVGLAVAWFVPAVRALPLLIWPSGVMIWVFTAGIGLALRAVSGGGMSGAFPWVTLGVLGLLLVGWRVVPEVVERRRERRARYL